MRSIYGFLNLSTLLIIGITASAQYTLNGSATQDNCHCYTLTQESFFQSGSVWNNNKIDLNQSFTFTFNVFLGCIDENGADGIAFILQPISTSIGVAGSGLGFQGITPSVGITLDTWQNPSPDNDPAYDHISIQANGDLDHQSQNNIAGPVDIAASGQNVEDCAWHILKISWDATAHKYEAYFDGALRLSKVIDLVNDIFFGHPMVFWGFTGSTGGSVNLQKFCTTLDPEFNLAFGQKRCIGEPINFIDASLSFGPIVKRSWNFGDGSPVDSVTVNPVHTYLTANDFLVTETITGADGCVEVNKKTLRIGTKPQPKFVTSTLCQGALVLLSDSSTVTLGTVNSWYWDLGNGSISTTRDPSTLYSTPGPKTIRHSVSTLENCYSDTVSSIINIDKRPEIDMSFSDACKNSNIIFTGRDSNAVVVSSWNWDLGDGHLVTGNPVNHFYPTANNYPISLYAKGINGCISDTIEKVLHIYGTDAFAGNDIVAAVQQPVQLHATGGITYEWTPANGLNDPTIDDPIAILNSDQTYILKATTPQGCETFDTVTVKVYKGPEIYIPNAFSPNNDGLNDVFRPFPVGITTFNYFKIYNRWGRELFSTTDAHGSWDGKYKGTLQPVDVYVWIAAGKDYTGKVITRKGYVTLVK